MVRYTQRAWYSPIGFMSQSLPSYHFYCMSIACLFAYPFRYRVADYWERISQDPGHVIRAKAIVYYSEMEATSQRNAHMFAQREEYGLHTNHEVRMPGEEIRKGSLSMDEDYFRVHYIDSMRIKAMQDEVEELKKQLAVDRK